MSSTVDLWAFSLRVYGHDPVAAACLWLQDHRSVDVNLLLYCCWLGARGTAFTPAGLAELRRAVSPWNREVVAHLRSARRWLKTREAAAAASSDHDVAALRAQIKALELEAERLEQRILERLTPPDQESGTRSKEMLRLMTENATRYLDSIDAALDAEASERLVVVLAAASGSSVGDAAREVSRDNANRHGRL